MKLTKAKGSAVHFMKRKPIKYAIRFYGVCTNVHTYFFSLFDNGKGNKTGIKPIK